MAYTLGFEHMVLLNQKQAERAGLFWTIVSNASEFDSYYDLLPKLKRAYLFLSLFWGRGEQ